MYIDSHAHLFFEDYGKELPDVIQRARDAGVKFIVVPGTTLETSQAAIELAEKYDFIYACVGYHPHEASKASDEKLSDIEALASQKKVVAIGEIGLDYHYDFSPRERQQDVFKRQIEIAIRRDLPVVVHTRESIPDAIEIVATVSSLNPEWKKATNGSGFAKRGVFHCFTGSSHEAVKLFNAGFFVSYPGIVTFKNSPVLPTLQTIGLSRILLETDSPYLAPVPLRGKRNEPAYIIHTARKIAELLNLEVEIVARMTTYNAAALFGIGDKSVQGNPHL